MIFPRRCTRLAHTSIITLVVILCLSFLTPQRAAHAAVFTVATPTDAALRNAINLANSSLGLDEITFTSSGTITLTSDLPNISDDLVINGAGQTITISGANAFRPFTVATGVEMTLIELTVSNGNAAQGGAVFNDGGTVSVYSTILSLNNATGDGGAIYNNGGTLNVLRGTINSNGAGDTGSAVYNNGGDVIITGSTVSFHASGDSAIYSTGGTFAILASTLNNNTSGTAGALWNDGSDVQISNSTFTLNSGTTSGAILVSGGNATIIHATIADNTGAAGGIAQSAGSVTVSNTILFNPAPNPNCTGTVTDGGYNLAFPTTCGFTNNLVSADPLLSPLALNGGPTLTIALDPNSLAIDNADPLVCAAPPINDHDQRCFGPRGQNCAIGAYDPGATAAMQAAQLSLAFGAAQIAPGGSTTLTYTFTNGNASWATLSSISINNSLPFGMSIGTGAVGGTCTQLPSTGFGASTVAIAGLSLAPGATCTITVPVTVSTTGVITNTVTRIFSLETGFATINASASLLVGTVNNGGGGSSQNVSQIPTSVTRLPATGYPPVDRAPGWELVAFGILSLLLVSGVMLILLSSRHSYR